MIITYVTKELVEWIKDSMANPGMELTGEQKTSPNLFNYMNHLPVSQNSELIGVIDDPKRFYVIDRTQGRLLLHETYAIGALQFETNEQLYFNHDEDQPEPNHNINEMPQTSPPRLPEQQIHAAEATNRTKIPANNSAPLKTARESNEQEKHEVKKATRTFCDKNRIAIPKTLDVYCINLPAERYEVITNNQNTPVYRVIDKNDNKIFSDGTRVPNGTIIWPQRSGERSFVPTAQITETGYKRMFTKFALNAAKNRSKFPHFAGAIDDKAPYVISELSKIKNAPSDAMPITEQREVTPATRGKKPPKAPQIVPNSSLFFDDNRNPITSTQKVFKTNQRADYFITHDDGTTQRVYTKTDSSYKLANGRPAPAGLILWPMRNMYNPSNLAFCVNLNNEMRLVFTQKTYRDVQTKRLALSTEELRKEHDFYNRKENFLGNKEPKQSITHTAPKQFTIPAKPLSKTPAKKYRFQTEVQVLDPSNLIQEGHRYYIQHGQEQVPVWSEYQYQTRNKNPNLEKIYIYEDDGTPVPAEHQLQIRNNRYYALTHAGAYERPVFVDFRQKQLVLVETEDNAVEPNVEPPLPSSDLLSFCSASQQVFSSNLETDLLDLSSRLSNIALDTSDEANFFDDFDEQHWLTNTPMEESEQESHFRLPDPEEMPRIEDASLIDEDLQPFVAQDYEQKSSAKFTAAPIADRRHVPSQPSSSHPKQGIVLNNMQPQENTPSVSNRELFAVSCEVSSLVEDLYLARLSQGESKEMSHTQAEPAVVKPINANPTELSHVQAEPEVVRPIKANPVELSHVQAKPAKPSIIEAESEEVDLILAELANETYIQTEPEEQSIVQAEPEMVRHSKADPAELSQAQAKSIKPSIAQAEPEKVNLILAKRANESQDPEAKPAERNVTVNAKPPSSIPEIAKKEEHKEDISAADPKQENAEEFYCNAIKSKLLSVSIDRLINTPLISSFETYIELIKKVKQNSIMSSNDYTKWLLASADTNTHPLFTIIKLKKEQHFLLYLNELSENLSKEELSAELLGKEKGLTTLLFLIYKDLPSLQAYFKTLIALNLPPRKLIEFLNQCDAHGTTTLHKALFRGDKEVLFYYLQQVETLLPVKKDFAELLLSTAKSGLNTLQYAAQAKDSAIFIRYLELINKVLTKKQLRELLLHKSPNNYTVLHDLIISGNTEGLNSFLNFLDSSIEEKIITYKEYVELLTTKSAGGTPLKDIIRRGNPKHLDLYLNKLEKVLIKAGQGSIDYFYLLTEPTHNNQSYLHEAMFAKEPTALKLFLSTLTNLARKYPQLKEKYAQLLTSPSQNEATPLSEALRSANFELIKGYFDELKKRLKPEELNRFLFETPAGKKVFDELFLVLDTKIYNYFTAEVQSLVKNTRWDKEYSQTLLTANNSGFSPLVEIIASKSEERLQDYFKELQMRLTKKHISTKQYANILLQATNTGLTPLHQALASGNETILRLYLKELKKAVTAGWISAKEYARYLIQLDDYKSNPLCMSRSKITQEFLASYLDEVKLQVEKGFLSEKTYADFLTTRNINGFTPVAALIESQSIDAFMVYWRQVEKVCTDKEKVHLLTKSRDDYPILHHIIQTKDAQHFTFYLEKLKKHLDKRISRGEYARLLLQINPLGDNFLQTTLRIENVQLLALYLHEVKTYCSSEEIGRLFTEVNRAGFTPLHQLVIFGTFEQLQAYFNELDQCQLSAKKYKSILTSSNNQGFSILLDLVLHGDQAKLELYFEKLKKYADDNEIAALLMQANNAGFTPLQDIFQSKSSPEKTALFVEKLLFYVPKDKLANVLFSQNKAGYTLLISAVIAANADNLAILFKELNKLLAKKLITRDDYIYLLTQPNANGFTPLHEAFVTKELNCLKIYLRELKEHLSTEQLRTLFLAHNKEGFTVLHQALVNDAQAVKHDSYEILQLCLNELKANLSAAQYASILIKSTNAGFTPLHQILKLGDFNSYSLYLKELQSVRKHISDKDYVALITTPNRGGFTPLKQAVFGSSFKVVKDLMDLLEKELNADEFYKALFHKNKNGDYFTTNSANNDYAAIRSLLSAKRDECREKLQPKPRTREEEPHSSGREKRGPQFFAPTREKATSSRTSEQKKYPSSHSFIANMNKDSRAEKHQRSEELDSHSSKRHDRRERDRDREDYRHERSGRKTRDNEDRRHKSSAQSSPR